jgi:uroporphyrinogen-III synthase
MRTPAQTVVVVTRPEGEDGPLTSQLRRLGLSVLHWPTVCHAPTESPELAAALAHVQDFDWIVFASQQAVAAVIARLPDAPPGVRVCAVGPSTARALRDAGWPTDMVPQDSSADGVVAAFASHYGAPGRVLYPASSRALPIILSGLMTLGTHITQVEAYRTLPAALDVGSARGWIRRRGVAAVTFASPSAVTELVRALGEEDFACLLDAALAAAMGRTTAAALKELGHQAVIPEYPTLESLALTTYLALQARSELG